MQLLGQLEAEALHGDVGQQLHVLLLHLPHDLALDLDLQHGLQFGTATRIWRNAVKKKVLKSEFAPHLANN